MSNHQSSNAAAATTKKSARAFEVLGTLNLGRKKGEDFPDIRTTGGTVTEEELIAAGLTSDEIRSLITKREIADPDAPIPPSQAEGYAALDALADVAQRVGALKRKGSEYRIGDQVFRGLVEFRAGCSVERLKAAIVERVKS